MGTIVEIQLKRLEKLLDDRKITLDLDQEATDWLAEKGYDPAYGARPLKRVIQSELQDPLAERSCRRDSRRFQRQDNRRFRSPELPGKGYRSPAATNMPPEHRASNRSRPR